MAVKVEDANPHVTAEENGPKVALRFKDVADFVEQGRQAGVDGDAIVTATYYAFRSTPKGRGGNVLKKIEV